MLILNHVVSQHRQGRKSSRKCTTSFIRRQNHNGEVVDRSGLLLVIGFATVSQISNHCQISCCLIKFCCT